MMLDKEKLEERVSDQKEARNEVLIQNDILDENKREAQRLGLALSNISYTSAVKKSLHKWIQHMKAS